MGVTNHLYQRSSLAIDIWTIEKLTWKSDVKNKMSSQEAWTKGSIERTLVYILFCVENLVCLQENKEDLYNIRRIKKSYVLSFQ